MPPDLLCLSAVRSNQVLPSVAAVALPDDEDQAEQEDSAAERANWTRERSIAEALVGKMMQQWQGPISTLSRAGKAFEGLEALLGGAQGGGFDLGVSNVFPSSTLCCYSVLASVPDALWLYWVLCPMMQSIQYAHDACRFYIVTNSRWSNGQVQ